MNVFPFDRTFSVRQALRVFRWVIFFAFLTYIGLLFQNAWTLKNGGLSTDQLRYRNFPERCRSMVDIHRGMGAPMLGSIGAADSFMNQLKVQNRVVLAPVESLLDDPECWGYAIRSAVDSSSPGKKNNGEANVRIVFFESSSSPQSFKRKVLSVNIEYEERE